MILGSAKRKRTKAPKNTEQQSSGSGRRAKSQRMAQPAQPQGLVIFTKLIVILSLQYKFMLTALEETFRICHCHFATIANTDFDSQASNLHNLYWRLKITISYKFNGMYQILYFLQESCLLIRKHGNFPKKR